MRNLALLGGALCTAVPSLAQSVVVPASAAFGDANSGTSFPWGRGRFAFREQAAYDTSAFTSQGITGPITIHRLRWRADANWFTHAGTYSAVTIEMSTCPVDHTALGTWFDGNHGADRRVVLAGAVQVTTTTGGTPNTWHVEAELSSPFVWNPAAGDLLVDVRGPADAFEGALLPQLDSAFGAGTPGSRVYAFSATGTHGTVQALAVPVLELVYEPGSHTARAARFGQGCYERPVTFYETFAGNAFNRAGQAMRLQPNAGGGYSVLPVPFAWHAPTTSPIPANAVSAPVALPWPIQGPGFATSELWLSKLGRIWFSPEFDGYFAPSANALRFAGPSLAASWSDYGSGSVTAEHDVVNDRFVVTWTDMAQFAVPTNLSTFQVAIESSGAMEVRWSAAANSGPVLVGFSQGRGAPDPGSRLLTVPFDTGPASTALRLSMPELPLLGATSSLVSDRLPAGAVAGFQLLSFVGYPAGLSAAGYGMSGCWQYVSPDVTVLLLAGGGAMVAPLSLPADPAFTGAHLFGQSLCLSPGANALGVIASNGIDLQLGQ